MKIAVGSRLVAESILFLLLLLQSDVDGGNSYRSRASMFPPQLF
jgi:hypothetical protein